MYTIPVVHGTIGQLYVYKLFYRQLPLWLFCNALLNTVSAFRLPSVEDSIECATCALQLGINMASPGKVLWCASYYVGQLTQLIHWIGSGSVSDVNESIVLWYSSVCSGHS